MLKQLRLLSNDFELAISTFFRINVTCLKDSFSRAAKKAKKEIQKLQYTSTKRCYQETAMATFLLGKKLLLGLVFLGNCLSDFLGKGGFVCSDTNSTKRESIGSNS